MTHDLDDHARNAREFDERSRATADAIRKYLLTANIAALGLVFGVSKNTGELSWLPFLAMILFFFGLVLVGRSFFLAKDTALKRRRAAATAARQQNDGNSNARTNWPHYGVCGTPWQGNTFWDTLSAVAFTIGVFLAAISLLPSQAPPPQDPDKTIEAE